LFLIQLVSYIHSYKEIFTILHHLFTNFSHSLIIFFIIVIIEYYYLIQDFYLFFYSTLFICSSITLYVFLMMTLHSYNKCHCSAHTEQFINKSSCVDRFTFTDDSELNIESLIKNLKNVIMKKLSMSYVAESSVSLSTLSVSFSATLSQSSTPVSVSDSLTSAISVSVTLTSATSALSGFTVSAFIISSPCFKKMLFALMSEIILIEDDNITETILFHSQASLITFSSFSTEKVMHTLSCKHSVSDDFCCHSSDSVSSSFISSAFTLSALTSDS
ncbi:hypothetical protein BDDG_13596, partial [Blastomyces dermatitidis ATCC 18188]